MADHRATFERALDAVVTRDLDAYEACLHDDFTIELPYAESSGTTTKAGLLKLVNFLLATFETLHFDVDRVYDLTDPDTMIVEYSSRFTARVGGVVYANRYVAILEFRDGLITRWVEYANPVAFDRAMAAIEERR